MSWSVRINVAVLHNWLQDLVLSWRSLRVLDLSDHFFSRYEVGEDLVLLSSLPFFLSV